MGTIDWNLLVQPDDASLHRVDALVDASVVRLSQLAARFLNVPVVVVRLLNGDRVCQIGLSEPDNLPAMDAFCQHVLLTAQPIFVDDLWAHPLARDLDAAVSPPEIACAGIPLLTTAGRAVAVCCVMDFRLRHWTEPEMSTLHDLSASIMAELEMRAHLYAQAEQQQQLSDALRASESKHRAFINQAHDAMSLCDEEGRIIEWNLSAVRLSGLKPEAVIGRYFWDVQFAALLPAKQTPEHYEMLRRSIMDLLRTGSAEWTASAIEETIIRPDGEQRVVAATISPIPSEKGVMLVHIIRDITERKRAEKQKLQLRLEKERMQVVVKFIEKASHEFRTPLTILYTSGSLMARLDDPLRREQKLTIIKGQVNRLTMLLDTLLMVVYLEGQQEIRRLHVDLREVIRNSCKQVEKRYERTNAVQLQLPQHLPPVYGVSGDLQMALLQLFDNACRYTPPDGAITVSAGADPDSVWVQIVDSGIGIAGEDIPHVFDAFWRKDEAHKTPGFGLGLSIVQLVINQHGGRIEFSSQLAVGTQVRIILPRKKTAETESFTDPR